MDIIIPVLLALKAVILPVSIAVIAVVLVDKFIMQKKKQKK